MNAKIIVQIDDSEIVKTLKDKTNKNERRKLIRKYLNENFVGKTIPKSFENKLLAISNNKSDTKHLVRNEHIDTSLALTKVEDLILVSEYLNAKPVTNHNVVDYFWYFKVVVEIDGQYFAYNLNIGRNKMDKHVMLYDITNYKKK